MSAIHLLPLGDANRVLVSALEDPLRKTFRASVQVKEFSVDIERFYDDARGQYNSTEILVHLKTHYPGIAAGDGTKALGIVPFDLFIPILTYVFGEAEVGGNVALVSYYRLAPDRYGLPSDRDLLGNRFLKEAVHELGHVHTLVHCSAHSCVMHSSSYVEEIDLKDAEFCSLCAGELNH